MAQALPVETEAQAAVSVNTDPRILRSRAALQASFVEELARTGELSRLTVTTVTERAGLTRRTFYAHYRDINDLAGAVAEQTIDELAALVESLCDIELDEVFAAIASSSAATISRRPTPCAASPRSPWAASSTTTSTSPWVRCSR